MAAIDLLLEHRTDGKSKKVLRVPDGTELFLIGSSGSSDLRISEAGVSGCHVALRKTENGWIFCNLSGSEETKINGVSAVETELVIDQLFSVEIGRHLFHFLAKERAVDLFVESEAAKQNAVKAPAQTDLKFQQLILRDQRGLLKKVLVLKIGETYNVDYEDGTSGPLPIPPGSDWTRTKIANGFAQQRLITEQEAAEAEAIGIDRSLKKPLAIAIILFLLLGTLISRLPSLPKAAELDKKSLDIIYNAKVVQKKREEAKNIAQAATQRKVPTEPSNQPLQKSTATNVEKNTSSPKAAQALASLRRSGLSSLVGRIARRAGNQGKWVAISGAAASDSRPGRAVFGNELGDLKALGSGGKSASSYRLAAVGTKGLAGGLGAKDVRNGTGLAQGRVGTGDVALVDEETVIEGGLDREVIADIIKRNLGQIRYCYERQLSSNPDLYGKVMVRFIIGSEGEVGEPKIDNSTMRSAMVEGCILRRVASWKFPQPKGGTQVRVSYPFLFKAIN